MRRSHTVPDLWHDIKPVEKAILVKRVHDHGLTIPVIAQRTGWSRRYVNDLFLLGSNPAMVKAVTRGEISATRAIRDLRGEAKS